jgi:hypothetical protein
MLFISLLSCSLEDIGAEVIKYDGCLFHAEQLSNSLVLAFTKEEKSITELEKAETNGITVINSPESIANCNRTNQAIILQESGIAYPESILLDSKSPVSDALARLKSDIVWLKSNKKGDNSSPDILCSARNQIHCMATLREFQMNHVEQVVVQENIQGDIIRFYGIRESGYFYWTYKETVNLTKFAKSSLFSLADSAAWLLGLVFYGGQAVVKENGEIVIIDMDAFPDFAPVREQASEHAAKFILSKAGQSV